MHIILCIIDFVRRQFSSSFAGTVVTEEQATAMIQAANSGLGRWEDGYAPFVKVCVLKNVWGVKCGYKEVLPGSKVVSEYTVRREGEIAYMHRYILGYKQEAAFIHLIAYSKEQLASEGIKIETTHGLVTINAEMQETVSPMTPETMIRNHMGKAFGGNGEQLNREEYAKSVEFWSKYAMVREVRAD